METVTNNSHAVVEAVESLRREVALLGGRMTEIEQRIHGSPVRTSPIETSPPKVKEFSEELLIAIGAAVAAYLGVAPHIRQIRLLGSVTWLQQGRVTIQASREFAVHHG